MPWGRWASSAEVLRVQRLALNGNGTGLGMGWRGRWRGVGATSMSAGLVCGGVGGGVRFRWDTAGEVVGGGRVGGDGLWRRRGAFRAWLCRQVGSCTHLSCYGYRCRSRERWGISLVYLRCSGSVRTGLAGWTTSLVFPPTFLCRINEEEQLKILDNALLFALKEHNVHALNSLIHRGTGMQMLDVGNGFCYVLIWHSPN
jgi:hypothetical protein